MATVEPKILKGMRDFLPAEMRRRKFVFATIERVFQRYGYEACETPTMEYAEILEGKYGEEERLLYRFMDQGERRVALKYDLTVPLARVVAMYQNELALPFKRYQMQPVFRSEKPQKGRYREFYQCDVDIVGNTSLLADAELVLVADEALSSLGFRDFTIRINHRRLLRGIAQCAGVPDERADAVAVAVDKLDKIGLDGVRAELTERGIAVDCHAKIMEVIQKKGTPQAMIADLRGALAGTETALTALDDLEKLFRLLAAAPIATEHYALDLTLARGLGYYTGPIFEIHVTTPKIGSIGGGGRYDGLIGMFSNQQLPACGISLGVERIIDVMTELNLFPQDMARTQVLVSLFDEENAAYALKIAADLRAAGINTETYLSPGKLKKQFAYADKRGIPFVVIAGPDERDKGLVTLKVLTGGEQRSMPANELAGHLTALIKV
jgi:histidyl-tRNA synthetase